MIRNDGEKQKSLPVSLIKGWLSEGNSASLARYLGEIECRH